MRYSYVEHRPRVSRTVSHGRASATQDGDWDSDDLERLVFEMPPSCRLQPDGPMAAYEAGKCPERIGMARATRP